MRIWSVHPKYLDAKGLVALWRETLLARKVLEGKTTGYRNHPQLTRFKMCTDPVATICLYLYHVYLEAVNRGYKFDLSKIDSHENGTMLNVTHGQVTYEMEHLKKKLSVRDPERFALTKKIPLIEPHPLFNIINGEVESWEIRNS